MVLFQQVDIYTGVNIRILLIVTIVVNWTMKLSGLFQQTQSLIRKLTPTIDKISVWWYIIV